MFKPPMTNCFLLSSESNSIVSKFFKLTLFNNAGVEIENLKITENNPNFTLTLLETNKNKEIKFSASIKHDISVLTLQIEIHLIAKTPRIPTGNVFYNHHMHADQYYRKEKP